MADEPDTVYALLWKPTMTVLPYLLLATTLTVRYCAARKWRAGFYVDLLSAAPWILFYANAEAWPLLAIPVIFGALDVLALARWWR